MSGLRNPGDTVEGQGILLQHGRQIAAVDYLLSIPTQTHFFINPTGNLKPDYENYIVGFILLIPQDAELVALTQYTLQLAEGHKKEIQIERRYKELLHRGKARISFAVRTPDR